MFPCSKRKPSCSRARTRSLLDSMKPWFAYMLLAGLVAVSACDDEEDLCDAKCECEGCSSWEYDDCVYGYERDARDAEYWGCPDFYDDWVDCRQDTYYC